MAIDACLTCGARLIRHMSGSGVAGPRKYCSIECRPVCAAPDCDTPSRSRSGHCAAHAAQLRRWGEIRPRRWATEWVCVVCGVDVPKGSGRRKHCSSRCQVLDSKYKGNRPKSVPCSQCGIELSLEFDPVKNRFPRADMKMCRRCKYNVHDHNYSVQQLADRDGTDCAICGETVDMAARNPDPFRASIDHKLPRSRGGTNDPQNLQLTHLWCNQVKSDREDFVF